MNREPDGTDEKPGELCYLASGPMPSRQANAVNVFGMCQGLKGQGFDVEILAPREIWPGADRDGSGGQNGWDDTLRIRSVYHPRFKGGTWWYRRRVRQYLNINTPDLVYGRNLWGCREAARLGFPVAYEAHLPVWRKNVKNRQAFESMIGEPSFSGLISISRALLKEAIKAYPQLNGRAFLAHDAATYRDRTDPPGREGRSLWDVVYTGSLYAGKGVEIILELAPRCPWARFRVVGGDEQEVLQWRKESAGRIRNIEFTGYVPHREIQAYLESADILIAPYLDSVKVHGGENDASEWMSPLKIFEYMGSERPIVCSDLPVLREVLVHGVNAMLAPPSRVDLWVRMLEELRDNRDLARAISGRAREDFEKYHTWEARAAQVAAALGWTKAPAQPAVRDRTGTNRIA